MSQTTEGIDKIKQLFYSTRADRIWYIKTRKKVHEVEALACAIRENALLDALAVLGLPKTEIDRMKPLDRSLLM